MVTRRCRGFTVIEMVMVIAVMSILIAIAAPSLTNMIATEQVRSASQDVYSSLAVARSEALTRNTTVTVEPVGGNWAQGWTITDAGGTVLRRQEAYARISATGPQRVIFNGDGRPDTTATPFAFSASNVSASNYRCVKLRLNGRSAISSGSCS